MAKDNLFLGFGRGSVGDVVFYRQGGQQVARARNRNPKNPKTALQLLQRVVLKTTSGAYSFLQDICNHSFQGFAEGTACQSRFNALNVEKFRNQLATVINSGDAEEILTSGESNFAAKGSSLVERNAYVISEGTLTAVPVDWSAQSTSNAFVIAVNLGSTSPTYNDVIDALALQAGDQLTFCGLSIDDTMEGGQFNGFEYARVILEPAGGDYSVPFLTGSAITDANEKNRGDFQFSIIQSGASYYLSFVPTKFTNSAGAKNSIAAAAVISSRYSGNTWLRSPQSLVLRTDRITVAGHLQNDHSVDYLGDAVYSFIDGESSLLYLNQAGASGRREIVPADAHLTGVTVAGRGLARDGSLSIGSGSGALVATMANGLDESSYVLALIAQGETAPYKSATFATDSATIADMDLVQDTVYVVALIEDGIVVDTFGTVVFEVSPASGQLTSVSINGNSVTKNSTESYTSMPSSFAATMSGYDDGHSYKLAIKNTSTSAIVAEAAFSAGSASITGQSIPSGPQMAVVLLCDDAERESWCTFSWIEE